MSDHYETRTGGATPVGPPPPGTAGHPPDVEDRSVGSLVGEVARDLSTLVRQEIELAKVETKEEAKKGGKAAGMLGGAGIAAHLLLVFVSVAAMWGLSELMHLGWAALIVAAVWGVVAAVLGALGRKQLRELEPVPTQTVETVKEDVQWARNRTS
ncbi:MAG TPA: phage holin family protein [Jiangellales bacterium]|nr:phage holin family protein [Jiangellales bacterium]